MSKGKVKLVYAPPRSVNLSEFTASGDDLSKPMGMCIAGASPHYSCEVGSGFVGACSPGATPDISICEAGSLHTYASCNPGSSASTTCISGAAQNF